MEILQSKDLYQADLLLVFIDGLQVGSITCLYRGYIVRDLMGNDEYLTVYSDVLQWFKSLQSTKTAKSDIANGASEGSFRNPGTSNTVQFSNQLCIK